MTAIFQRRLIFGAVIVLAGAFGYYSVTYLPMLINALSRPSPVYQSQPNTGASSETAENLPWEALLPDVEKDLLTRYQVEQGQDLKSLTQQVLNSINAASDNDYQEALISTNTQANLKGKTVAISGFIVPVDFHPNQNIQRFFLVPYFGACLHFPPPPPNQILYAKIQPGLSQFDINQAYTVTGTLDIAMFEDPLGTSAYAIDVHQITPFIGHPDTFRTH